MFGRSKMSLTVYMLLPQLQVKLLNVNSVSAIFNFTCLGEPASQSSKLVVIDGRVNKPMVEACQKKTIRMAFNQYERVFDFDEEKKEMIEYNTGRSIVFGAYTYETLTSFFASHDLTPTWLNGNGTWGWFDSEIGLWNGAVGLVS